MDDFKHYTVMLNEAVDALECQDGKIYVESVRWNKWDRLKMSHLFVEIWKNDKSN